MRRIISDKDLPFYTYLKKILLDLDLTNQERW